MPKNWPVILRDPIHNIIPFGNNECDQLLLKLIDTREFQRLRRIKQLGFTEFVFPGANHSRFSHSIGVMQTARRFLIRLGDVMGRKLKPEHKKFVLVAALLHDLGHGPFSHAFEKITGDPHENRTREIIADSSTEVNAVLREKKDENLPSKFAHFFDENAEDRKSMEGIPSYLSGIISSQLDADRFDYLLRDSHATGTNYGEFDLAWIVEHLLPDPEKGRLILDSKALFAAETYVFARHHMYQTVYFHKATRSAEVMLRLLFKRFKELLAKCDGDDERKTVVPGATAALVRAFSGKIDLQTYLQLDDATIVEFLKRTVDCADELAKSLGVALLNRRLYKGLDVTEVHHELEDYNSFVARCREMVASKRHDPEVVFCLDSAADTPYKPYDPDAEKPAKMIYVQNSAGEPRELSQLTDSVDALKKRRVLHRHYFPEGLRGEIEKIAKETIQRTRK